MFDVLLHTLVQCNYFVNIAENKEIQIMTEYAIDQPNNCCANSNIIMNMFHSLIVTINEEVDNCHI